MTKLTDNEKKLLAAASAHAAYSLPLNFDGSEFRAKLKIFDGTYVTLKVIPGNPDECTHVVIGEKSMQFNEGYSWDQCFQEFFDEYHWHNGGQNDTN